MFRFIQNLVSKTFFSQVSPVIKLGRTKALLATEMPPLHKKFDPSSVGDRFASLSLGGGTAFLLSIARIIRPELLLMTGVAGAATILNLIGPIFIHRLVSFVSGAAAGNADLWSGIFTAMILSGTSVTFALTLQHYFYLALGNMQLIVNGLNKRIYAKSLRISRQTQQRRPSGDVVNLMGTDSDAVAEFFFAATDLFFACITILAVTVMLFWFLGVAALAGVAVLAGVAPITRHLVRRFTRLDNELMTYRDDRVSLVSQILSGIRIVKYFAWSHRMLEEVGAIRQKEVASRKRIANSSCLALMVYFAGSTLVGVVAFGVYLSLGMKLDAATVFSCIALFSMLDGPFGNLTEFIANISAGRVSADRIAGYLGDEEMRKTKEGHEDPVDFSAPGESVSVRWENVSARYGGAEKPAITGVDLTVKPGESIAVVGPVGGGKSSLLLSLLGEIPIESGTISFPSVASRVRPRIAYVPQEAFIMNGSLRDNIIFGADNPDQEFLTRAIYCAALERDLQAIAGGLGAEIGEHGINLSGGQKQRVGLARAVVARAGLVLLDDPLSAVDHGTEQMLVDRLLFGEWSRVTRIAVTHRLNHLKLFDRIVFVEKGEISGIGTFAELLMSSPRFARFYAEMSVGAAAENTTEVVQKEGQGGNSLSALPSESGNRITEDEDRESGAVKGGVYLNYIRAMAGTNPFLRRFILPLLVLSTLVVTVLPILQSGWLAVWTNHLGGGAEGTGASLVGSDGRNVLIYGAIGLAVLLAVLLRHVIWMYRAIAAGQVLHDRALTAVLKTNLRFFDATPVGRILNRFSRDVDACERELSWAFEQTVRSTFHMIGSVVVLLMVLPAVAVAILPMLFVYGRVQAGYRASSREAQRLTSVARSPRFAHFKETLQGLSVIRAFGRESRFAESYEMVLREYQRMFHALVIFNRWFSIRIPLIGAVVSACVTIGIVLLGRHGAIMAGTAGLGLMYALRFWEALNWSVRSFSQVEAKMTAVERLERFARLEPEVDVLVKPVLGEDHLWPSRGEVRFDFVSARYAPHLPAVLRGVNFFIPGGKKVGFVGRTGAGKSTVFQVLYRFINAFEGRILIDGIDTASVPLTRLRRAIAIIPQDPTLFRGTLRSNLDRFAKHTDEDIWNALRRAHLFDFVLSLPKGLDADVKENGYNFSQGQRQLFCLARALLLDLKIIVMDEATASVDVETDQLIQQTIREECRDKTVLIIAHRLETLRDCDMVIEISDGRAVVLNETPAGGNSQRKKELVFSADHVVQPIG